MADKIKITILEDGTIKTETDVVSMANHQNAEGFLRSTFALLGGTVNVKHKHGTMGHFHSHAHGEQHHHH